MKILVFNAGSSSYKLALYDIERPTLEDPQNPIWNGTFEWHGSAGRLQAWASGKNILDKSLKRRSDHQKTIAQLLETAGGSLSAIDVIGHRIVHGGSLFDQPVRITSRVKQSIKQLFPLAPLHNPANLAGIEVAEALMPTTPQIAVFDTAFHTTLSETASTYPGPYQWKKEGIKRYGFHGISHHYCAHRCATLLKKPLNKLKIVCCHLGNGASLTAIDKGKSVDTTMGFTPIDGLMMGTRSGALDPGILIYLEQQKHQTADQLFHTLNNESGLKGISGISSDMRDILSFQKNPRAQLAYQMYVHSLRRNIGAMIGALGGIDTLIFTAGIGENVSKIRQESCQAFQHMEIFLDSKKNRNCRPDAILSAKRSKVDILVIKTQEDWGIACVCWKIQQAVKGAKRIKSTDNLFLLN